VIVDRLEQDRRRRLRIADECSEQDVGIDYDALDAAACPAARRRLCWPSLTRRSMTSTPSSYAPIVRRRYRGVCSPSLLRSFCRTRARQVRPPERSPGSGRAVGARSQSG
jgi:hypothetical protein